MDTITTQKAGRRTYVYINNRVVAAMERSPFTGEWCYGVSQHPEFPEITHWFRPPFAPTRLKTAKAAAKFIAANL